MTDRDRRRTAGAASPGVVAEGLFTHRFTAVAREMGERLRRTALSTNVRDRLDFSCGILDPDGRLVVNAPHIPVHLGALGLCVRRVMEVAELGPGDSVVTNHPAFGGSHLPDVTVVTAVHDDAGGRLGFVASRAHHAEIGGTRPGSMPPDAECLAEEGVVIPPTLLVREGRARWEDLEALLREGPYPSRAPEENLADVAAAVAANHHGAEAIRRLAADHGRETVTGAMAALGRRAAEVMGRIVADLDVVGADRVGADRAGAEAEERLDDGSPLRVRVRLREGGRLELDFTGSAPVHPGNLNAPEAVLRSVVLYVLRLLVAEELPLNEGLLEPVDLVVPEGILSPPFSDDPAADPAVVGGNVETSQRLVDTLIRALGLAAGSQGTMNNVLFGDETFGYYETVAGGAGAGPGFAGASGVHTHMTNTRITDPEVLEARYPVRLERFGLRRGSGGAGRYRGGDGVVRELAFLRPLSLSVLGQHRVEAPYGMDGGKPGATGRVRVLRGDGREEILGSVDAREVEAGDRLLLETPGGGGWGEPESEAGENRREEEG